LLLKVAIVHDWLTLTGGAERVLKELLDLYPQADLFCVVCFLAEHERDLVAGRALRTTFIQKLPWARTKYRAYLPLMPIAIEQLDVSGYDLVISSSYAVAKGVITGPDQIHVSYVYSPIRYAWDLQHTYLNESRLTKGIRSVLARLILHYIRIWDSRTAAGVDAFVGISHFIARRIRKTYGRDATVIYPPVDIGRFQIGHAREDFYLTASRMVPYKRMPLIAQAFASMPDRKLIIIGDGPDLEAVKRFAAPNVTILGRQSDAVLTDHLQRAKAFIFAAEEDFGIVPLEAQACGTPVVAFGRGGSLETIRGHDGPEQTGVFYDEPSVDAIASAVAHLDERLPFITPEACRKNAERFSTERFRREIKTFIDHQVQARRGGNALVADGAEHLNAA
jgi:glycosyltransferase involved in cell wall biosynthesis